jgi:hypothetical protein
LRKRDDHKGSQELHKYPAGYMEASQQTHLTDKLRLLTRQ